MIDPRAIIDPTARLGNNVAVGPWTLIGPDVEIGDDGSLWADYQALASRERREWEVIFHESHAELPLTSLRGINAVARRWTVSCRLHPVGALDGGTSI